MNNSFSFGKNNSFIYRKHGLPNNLFMKTFGQNLRASVAATGKSEAEIARSVGISPRRFSYYLNDERQPDFGLLRKMCDALNTTPDFLFNFGGKAIMIEAKRGALNKGASGRRGEEAEMHLGNTPDLPDMPDMPAHYEPVAYLETKAGMGGGSLPPEAFGPPRYIEASLIAALRASAKDLLSTEVEGQSMEDILYSGDQILVDIRKKNVSEPGIFLLWDGDGVVCKWVERQHGSEPPMLRIFSENKRFKEYSVIAEDAVIHGRVVWFARRL